LKEKPIIFNGSYFSRKPSGISVVSQQLAISLKQEKISLYAPFKVGNSKFHKLPKSFYPENGFQAHLRRLSWNQFKLSKILKNNKDSILFSPLPEAPITKGIRSVILIHDLLPLRMKSSLPLSIYHFLYVPLVVKNASKVLCNSLTTANEVSKKLKVPDKKLEIIKLGFNRDNFENLNLKRDPFMLIISRHSPHKNLPKALIAFSIFKNLSKNFSNYKLKIAGSFDKKYTPNYKKLVKELNLNECCDWLDWISESKKIHLLNSCKALIIPSLWEGFGLPALEALACGTPIIASEIGAIKEIIGDNGIYFNPNDTYEIANAMSEVARNNSIEDSFKKFGPKIASEYSWENAARIIEKTISQI
tara:strand:+ start:124 stop:1206 length:1083 start_codon:yes stop_codon:yes gene_type:complete